MNPFATGSDGECYTGETSHGRLRSDMQSRPQLFEGGDILTVVKVLLTVLYRYIERSTSLRVQQRAAYDKQRW